MAGETTVFEGTWAELMARADEFAPDTRLRLEVIGDEAAAEERAALLQERLARRLARAEELVKDAPLPMKDPHEQAFAQIMDEKYRRLGLRGK